MNIVDLLLESEDRSPLNMVIEAERKAVLADCEKHLTGKQMQLLILIYQMGYSLLDVAIVLDVGKTRAHQIHQRTLRILKQELESRGITNFSQI